MNDPSTPSGTKASGSDSMATSVLPSRLGFGAAPIGNLYSAVDEATARAAVDLAWNVGVRYFDTAPHYGLGLSERRLGEALRHRPRSQYAVSTKVGRILVPTAHLKGQDPAGFVVPADHTRVWDFSRDGILRSVEDSLHRTGLDRLDLIFLHDPDEHWRQALDQGYPALAELRAQGVVKAIGAGMNQTAMLTDFVRNTDMDAVMLAGRYTLLEQGALDDLLPLCEQRGVSVIAAGVFNSGLLATPRPSADLPYNYQPARPGVVRRATLIADVCERHGTTLPAAALQFPLAHPAVVNVTIGCRTSREVAEAAAHLASPLPPPLWKELKERGLLRQDAPVPGRSDPIGRDRTGQPAPDVQ
ncbi:aldo/keto reductase [Streptomyces sp. NPDC085932]|uniref:aldo/keto reductase n=1 Tax=Streptomyces sp. NPDC085932 TaxID=3365741 RepID=UPI0037CDA0DD